jgi:hypothetical protein
MLATKLNFLSKKLALSWTQFQLSLPESVENSLQARQHFLECIGVNDNIVDIANGDIVQQSTQDFLHQTAVRGGGTTKTHADFLVLPLAMSRGNACFMPVVRVDRNLVEAGADIKAAEQFLAGKSLNAVINATQRVFVDVRLMC